MYATMSGWWTSSTAAKSRALNASSPFFISARRRAVRLVVSVVAGIVTPFLVVIPQFTAGTTVTLVVLRARAPSDPDSSEDHGHFYFESAMNLEFTTTIL